jgi:uncharacterized protein (TIGR02391 family)
MDRAWMRDELTSFSKLLDVGRFQAPPPPSTLDAGQAHRNDHRIRLEPVIREILRRLDPALADFDGHDSNSARNAVNRGLGILTVLDEREDKLAADAPVLSADRFHPWIWQAARTLWDSAHYRHAVQAAATAINDHAQHKLGRRDIADTQLMQEAFSPLPPEPGKPRLRCPGDPDNRTTQSRQRGALQYAAGCFGAIRNPATHEQDEWDQQTALEYLSALSVLARWIDQWALDAAP